VLECSPESADHTGSTVLLKNEQPPKSIAAVITPKCARRIHMRTRAFQLAAVNRAWAEGFSVFEKRHTGWWSGCAAEAITTAPIPDCASSWRSASSESRQQRRGIEEIWIVSRFEMSAEDVIGYFAD